MIEMLSWVFVIAYFSVFLFGLFTCFYLAKNYWMARTIQGNTAFAKRSLTLKAAAIMLIALCAVGGLLQAIAGT